MSIESVHGVPGERVLRAGDLVKVDVTAELDGYVADACESIPVGAIDRQTERLRAAADAALHLITRGQPLVLTAA